MKGESSFACWIASACVLIGALGGAKAADLYVTDATPMLQLQLPGTTPTAVFSIRYEPAGSGDPGAIFSVADSTAVWEWERSSGYQYRLQMILDTDNKLELYPPGHDPTGPSIVLNPAESDPYITIGGHRVLTRGNAGSSILSLGLGLANSKLELWGTGIGQGYGLGVTSADFRLHTDATWSDFTFRPGASAAPNVIFKGNGNVGIGTTAPQSKLDVAGEIRTQTFRSTGSTYLATQSGNVGIGTTVPSAKLHVTGTARFDGVVRVNPSGDISMGSFTAQ